MIARIGASTSPFASTSRFTLQTATPVIPESAAARSTLTCFQQPLRRSHVGAAPIHVPAGVSVGLKQWPIQTTFNEPLPTTLRSTRTLLVRGPLGAIPVPLFPGLKLSEVQEKAKGNSAATKGDGKSQEQMPFAAWASSPSKEGAKEVPSRIDGTKHRTEHAGESPLTVEFSKMPLRAPVRPKATKDQNGQWGLSRALLNNAVNGVSEGHSAILTLVGVGYRAAVEPVDPEALSEHPSRLRYAFSQHESSSSRFYFISEEQKQAYHDMLQEEERLVKSGAPGYVPSRISLRLGYSHPIHMVVPYGISASCPAPTKIVLKGVDKWQLGQFAAQLRAWRPPEPYKGKGVFINGETIKIKTPKKK